jgi:ElaA protein
MITWNLKTFDQLSVSELYAIMRLRIEVFIVEQNCPYQDADDKDQSSYHLMGWEHGALVAYTRLLPPGLSFAEKSIGRVVTSPRARKRGLGYELMNESINQATTLFGKSPTRIGAQLYLKNFYEKLGFRKDSDIYLEDGIEHIEMVLE